MKIAGAVVASLMLSLAATGCAPGTLETNPESWPAEYAGRKLYTTPNAWIYASSAAAAGEVDRLMIEIRKEFLEITGQEAKKLLVIASDKDDPMLGDARAIFDDSQTMNSPGSPDVQNQTQPTEKDKEDQWNTFVNEQKKLGISHELTLMATPLQLDESNMVKVTGLPDKVVSTAGGGFMMPTNAFINYFISQTIDAGMKKSDISLLTKATMVMATPFMKAKLHEMTDIMQKFMLFNAYTALQTGWSKQQKQDAMQKYEQRHYEELNPRLPPVP